jgi:hypothetical protein
MKYICEKCVYSTNVKQNYNNHLLSKRHQDIQNETISKNYSFNCKNCNKGSELLKIIFMIYIFFYVFLIIVFIQKTI